MKNRLAGRRLDVDGGHMLARPGGDHRGRPRHQRARKPSPTPGAPGQVAELVAIGCDPRHDTDRRRQVRGVIKAGTPVSLD